MMAESGREIELRVGEALPGAAGVMWRITRILDGEVIRGTARTDIYHAISTLLNSLAVEVAAHLSDDVREAEAALEEIWRITDHMRRHKGDTMLVSRLAANNLTVVETNEATEEN